MQDGTWRSWLGQGVIAALLVGASLAADEVQAGVYGSAPEDTPRGGSLTVGSIVEPPALDPFHQGADARIQVSVLMYQGLMYEDPSGTAKPLLAESYEVSEDGLTYTFKLREGVTFHTGQPMTAADVKYSYDYIRDPENGSPGAPDYQPIESIEAPDDRTVVMRLSEPNAALLMTLTNKYGAVVPAGFFDDPNARNRMNQESVGTGPFQLAGFQPNSFLSLARFEGYWDESEPRLDEINFLYLPNSASMLVALQNERVDLAVLSRPQDAAQLEGAENLTITRSPSLNQKSIDLDLKYGPLGDIKVRQAIANTVDKEEVMQAAIGGYGTVIGTMVAAMQDKWGVPIKELPNQGPDLEKAKQLMRDAGHEDGLDLKLTTIIGYDWMDPAAVTLAEQLRPIGINLEIEKVDLGVWIQNFRNQQMGFTFNDWGTQPDPNLLFFRHFHRQPEGADFRNWNSEKGSALLLEGRREQGPERRQEIYDEFQNVLAEEVPTVMMFSSDYVVAANDRVKNYEQHPTGWYFGLINTFVEE